MLLFKLLNVWKIYNAGVRIGFGQTAYSVTESNTAIRVCMYILNGSIAAGHSVTVRLQSIDETATGYLMYHHSESLFVTICFFLLIQ